MKLGQVHLLNDEKMSRAAKLTCLGRLLGWEAHLLGRYHWPGKAAWLGSPFAGKISLAWEGYLFGRATCLGKLLIFPPRSNFHLMRWHHHVYHLHLNFKTPRQLQLSSHFNFPELRLPATSKNKASRPLPKIRLPSHFQKTRLPSHFQK